MSLSDDEVITLSTWFLCLYQLWEGWDKLGRLWLNRSMDWSCYYSALFTLHWPFSQQQGISLAYVEKAADLKPEWVLTEE